MINRASWETLTRSTAFTGRRLAVNADEVVRPDGKHEVYEWVQTPDQVRVAAVVEGSLIFTRQVHYLLGEMLQLPGGGVDPSESPEDAARRELREETGLSGGTWASHNLVRPIPSLTDMSVHLWAATDLVPGEAHLESAERDLRIVRLTLLEARQAVFGGRLTCAASCALVLRLVC